MKLLNVMGVPIRRTLSTSIASVTLVAAATVVMTPTSATAIATAVPLGTVDSFAVLGGQSVTNTGPTQLTGDLGVSPGTSISGFPPGLASGATYRAGPVALQAQSDLTIAYDNAAGQASDMTITSDLGGQTLAPGVYTAPSSAGLTGTLTLDAGNDPNAVWVFQIGSALTTATSSRVLLVNGASPCNVFWQIGSSATLGSNTSFVGTIMSLTSTGLDSGATVIGRALARNGSVTLNNNVITRPLCGTTTGGTTTGGTTTAGTTGGTTGGLLGGVTTGGLLGGVTTGGLLGGATSGGLLGGAVAGNTVGGSTVGNVQGNTQGNTAGNTGGGGDQPPHEGKPPYGDQPPHEGKPPYGDQPTYGDQPPHEGKPAYGDQPQYGDTPQYGKPDEDQPNTDWPSGNGDDQPAEQS